MEFVLSITNNEQISKTLCGIINIGIRGYSFDNILSVDIEELDSYINITKDNSKKLFISMNRIFHEHELASVSDILSNKILDNVDGIYFSDLGLIEFGIKYNVIDKMIYTPETLLTNNFEIEALKDSGVSNFSISNEIIKEDILDIIETNDVKFDMVGFGYVSMFYSKRKLVSLYNSSNNEVPTYKEGYIIEEQRNGKYPILEGEYGTHIYRDKIFSIHNDKELLNNINYIRIESYKVEQSILEASEQALINNNSSLLNKYSELIDDGFLNTKTKYKKVL